MRENEFERKVQEQMEELRLRPSDAVWPKVEEELRGKKKRRVVFYLFFLAGLGLLGYTGYTLLQKDSKPPVAQQASKDETTDVAKSSVTVTPLKETTTKKSSEQQSATVEKINKESIPPAKEFNGVDKNQTKNNTQKTPDNGLTKGKNNSGDKQHKPVQQVQSPTPLKDITAMPPNKRETAKVPVEKKDVTVANGVDQQKSVITSPAVDVAITETAIAKDKAPAINNNGDTDPAVINKQTVDSVVSSDTAIALATPKNEQLKENNEPVIAKNTDKRSRLKIGIEVSGGVSPSRENLVGLGFGIFGGEKSLQTSNLSQAQSGGTNASPGQGVLPPTEAESGTGYKLGLTAELKLSERNSLAAGIRYAYLSEKIKVGSYQNAGVYSNSYQQFANFYAPRYYRSVNQESYTNEYHFLEMPLQYQYQLNKGNKTGILWSLGLTPGYLLSTNALVYDTTAGGIYYQNNDAFKRFHLSFQTGFAFRFGYNKKLQWSIGPDLSLDMTRVMKEDVFTDKKVFDVRGTDRQNTFLKTQKLVQRFF